LYIAADTDTPIEGIAVRIVGAVEPLLEEIGDLPAHHRLCIS
jgi:hypothetical protein